MRTWPLTKKFGGETYRFVQTIETKKRGEEVAERIRRRWHWKVRVAHSLRKMKNPNGPSHDSKHAIYERKS